jgi:NAD(P)H-hydrate epimerase
MPQTPGQPPLGGDDPAAIADPEPEIHVFSRESVREVDRLAGDQYAIPSVVLMENAAFHLCDVALHLAGESPSPRVLIVCGPGNNGGDGLAVARHLHNAGASVAVLLSGPAAAYKGDAAMNLAIVQKMGLPLSECPAGGDALAAVRAAVERLGHADLVIDALLGTGLSQAVKEPLASFIGAINELAKGGALVVSADIPSGLDADTGEPLGVAVHADATVTFVGLKQGFLRLSAQEYIGDVVVADIGAPRELTARLGRRVEPQEMHEEPQARPGHEHRVPRRRRPGRAG